MTIGTILFISLFTLIPTFAIAYGITATVLDRKHKLGEFSYVEFFKHQSRTLEQFECSERDLEKTVSELKRDQKNLKRRH